jgi:heme/copper-type cytochrome/quinol oxidase subunit 2
MFPARAFLAAGLIALAGTPGASATPPSAPRRIDVTIEGHFGHFVPTEIKAAYGDTIHVTLKAMDSAHGFKVEGKDFDITAYPGLPAEVSFVADWVGGREWFCTFDCGPQHGTMTGMIIVEKRES